MREYKIEFAIAAAGAASAVMNALYENNGSAELFEIRATLVPVVPLPTPQMMEFELYLLAGGTLVTTGATSLTPSPIDPGDSVSGLTAWGGPTVWSGSTVVQSWLISWYLYQGLRWTPPSPIPCVPPPTNSASPYGFALIQPTAASGTFSMNIQMFFRERGTKGS